MVFTLAVTGCKRSKTKDPVDPVKPEVYKGIEIANAGTYEINFADLSWEKVDVSVADHMNTMAGLDTWENDKNAMKIGAKAVPDLSQLTGGGLYIESVANTEYDLTVNEFKWESGAESLVETFVSEFEAHEQTIAQWKCFEEIAISPDTGFGWGGFANNKKDAVNCIIMKTAGYIQFTGNQKDGETEEIKAGGNKPGSYIYTIFDPEGKNNATQTVANMGAGKVTITFDNESGDGSQYPERVRIMIRDANGDWFLSVGGTEDPGEEDPEESYGINISAIGTYQIAFTDLGWEKVDLTISERLSKMKRYDGYENNPYAMKVLQGEVTPDLSQVSGGGLYVESVADSTDQFIINSFTWTSGEESVTETFAGAGWNALVGYKGNEDIIKSPATGFGWGAYANNNAYETNAVLIQDGQIQFLGAEQVEDPQGPGNISGSYTYTVFDENYPLKGSEEYDGYIPTPTTTVSNMSSGHLTIKIGGGTQNFPEKIRLLLRDANGDWFLSTGGTATVQ